MSRGYLLVLGRCHGNITFGSGKTSLLFQQALTFAERGSLVLFISPSHLDRLPLLGREDHLPPPHILKNIQFKSVKGRVHVAGGDLGAGGDLVAGAGFTSYSLKKGLAE